MLLLDSITRFANAQGGRLIYRGTAYFQRLYPFRIRASAKVAGKDREPARGSITGLYTVLVDGDDMNEPIADAVRRYS